MASVRLRSVGNSVGVVFPKELLAKYNLSEGDTVQVVETPDGFLLTPVSPDVEEQLRLGRELMKTYRETFAALAK
ncbi:AbrB/MazE/SpoVT family DNA-binding domain-containing protein [Falsiroseomonas bella]|uniref:AbrB/MazE/SpoVT family DNA-binding domain-containing protein n=1 Tax=Falsiroseomonas bella TaxID=2184016 RepID=A0A317FI01_9PROT|nr:AbrB/MazE/SpoVT family DNA-binding domain-containing protein [Falsiroseomonas bella]